MRFHQTVFSSTFARLSERTLGTANLVKENRVGAAYFVRLLFVSYCTP